jgi:CubicO group peptidase (beta-lactamase class C family)
MLKYAMLVPLLGAFISPANAETARTWTCHTANDARERRAQVQRGMLPQLIFAANPEPASIETRMRLYHTPALSVAVVRAGKLDWSAAWGQLQIGGAKAECSSIFQAGSIAKPATLLAALRMKSKGEIDFDESVETYLSSYHLPAGAQTDANPVTFRNLFAHTAGITPGGYAGYSQNERLPTDQQIVRGEAPSNSRKVEVVNPPGASLSYSGGGYTLIEIALQDRLNKPFDQIMREWLIAPIGMRQADFAAPLPAARHSRTARGHRLDGSAVPGGWNNHPEQAAAGLWATATDLAMLLLEMRKARQGKSKVFDEALIHELLASPIQNHAYGFRLDGEGDEVFITHYGGTIGYRAGMTLNLHTGDGAVFLANSDDGANLGAEFFSAVARVYGWGTFREERVERTKLPAEVLQSFAGNYVFTDAGFTVSVRHEGDSLELVFQNGDRLPLVLFPLAGDAREFVHETGVRARFDGAGKDMRLRLFGQSGQRQASSR